MFSCYTSVLLILLKIYTQRAPVDKQIGWLCGTYVFGEKGPCYNTSANKREM